MTPLITLHLPFPVSINHALVNVQGRGRVASLRAKRWRKEADDLFLTQKRGLCPIQGHYSMLLVLDQSRRETAKGGPRRIDCGNFEKLVSDRLVSWGVISDDRYADFVATTWGEAEEGCTVHLFASELALCGWRISTAEKEQVE